jgi:gamma-glutamyltranspeptidase/glutathione hydrolase
MRRRFHRRDRLATTAFAVFLLAVAGPGPRARAQDAVAMEADGSRVLAASLRPTSVASSPLGMVVTSTPEASWAGVRMLEAGGNAVDAAVAAAFALTASDPGGSGIGGQTWIVIRLATGEERVVFCPSRAPLRVDRTKVGRAREKGNVWGPMAVAVPTTVATLAHALVRYGTKGFAEVLGPAIEAADAGYRVQSFEHGYLGDYGRRLADSDLLSSVYLTGPKNEEGIPGSVPLGTCVRFPGLAETLRRLAEAGPSDFYSGSIAAKLDEEMRIAGGFLSRSDLARVPGGVVDTAPVRGSYRGRTVLTVPSPAGGSTLVMALQILDAFPSEALARAGTARGHAIVEAMRLARAEAAAHPPGGEVVEGPLRSAWLSREWAARQAKRIRPGRALAPAEVQGSEGSAPGPPGVRGTSHVSVVDAQGNAVSLTQSLGRYFGAAWAPSSLGFLLNAFVEPFDPGASEGPAFLGPGAQLASPVAPLVVVRYGRVELVAGAGGSSRIPSMLLNLLAGIVDGGERPVDAGARPRVLWEDDTAGPRVMLEIAPPFGRDAVAAFREMGYGNVFALTSPGSDSAVFGGIHAIAWNPEVSEWEGFADGRRPGVAAAPAGVAPLSR